MCLALCASTEENNTTRTPFFIEIEIKLPISFFSFSISLFFCFYVYIQCKSEKVCQSHILNPPNTTETYTQREREEEREITLHFDTGITKRTLSKRYRISLFSFTKQNVNNYKMFAPKRKTY